RRRPLMIHRRGFTDFGLRLRDPLILVPCLLMAWTILQLVPLPSPIIRVVSPTADAIYRDTFPGYGDADGSAVDVVRAIEARGVKLYPEAAVHLTPEPVTRPFEPRVAGKWDGWRTISLLPEASRERLLWFFALWIAFVAIRRRGHSRERRRAYRDILFVTFLLQMAFGLVYAATGNGRLYWIRETIEQTRPFGTYVNPTNFAGVMELAVPWMTGCLMASFYKRGRAAWGEARTMMLTGGIVLGILATFASASRSASVMIPLGVLAVVLVSVRGWRTRVVILLLCGVLAAAALPTVRRTHLGERVTEMLELGGGEIESVGRTVSLRASVDMLGDYWRGGCGIGAFRDVFPHYIPAGEIARYNQLHNDYLQVAIEGGLPVVLLLGLLIVVFWGRLLRPSSIRSPRGLRRQQIGLVTGLVLLSLHAIWDFNHQIPANALLFVTLAALALGRIERRNGSARESESRRNPAASAVGAIAIVLFVLLAVQGWIGGWNYTKGRRFSAAGDYAAALPHVDRTGIGHHKSSSLWLAGQVRLGLWHEKLTQGESPDSVRPLLEDAFENYTQAISLSPASGWYWANLGDLYYQLERTDRVLRPVDLEELDADPRLRVGRWGRVAVGLTRLGIRREPNVYTFHDQLAFMFWHYECRDDAQAAARSSAEVLPLYRIHAYDLLDPAPDELLRAFAEGIERSVGHTPFIHDVRRQISRGIVAMKLGEFEEAARHLQVATQGDTSSLLGSDAQFQLGRVLMRLERFEEAAASFRAADGHPNFARVAPLQEGLAHEQAGNLEAALAAYGRARRAHREDLEAALGYARVAGRLGQRDRQASVLVWATRNHPGDRRPWLRLLEHRLDSADIQGARGALEELVKLGLPAADQAVWNEKIESASHHP
ncbi:MAG: O-antigen ligase family protein, partial [Acidobacteriota bacterium]|nr:O-antigen ligase family protein [Acidobacteriota bacterium]